MILVSIGVLAPRHALAGRYEAWTLQVLVKVTGSFMKKAFLRTFVSLAFS
jgi:hypothetical protein